MPREHFGAASASFEEQMASTNATTVLSPSCPMIIQMNQQVVNLRICRDILEHWIIDDENASEGLKPPPIQGIQRPTRLNLIPSWTIGGTLSARMACTRRQGD
jgi:hypothetical protein